MTHTNTLTTITVVLLLLMGAIAAYVLFPKDSPSFSVPAGTPPQKEAENPFRALTIQTDNPRREIAEAVGEENVEAVLDLNRIDMRYVEKGMTLTVSGKPGAFSPFPDYLGSARDIPKLILISQRVQAFALYENGQLVRSGPASTGKQSTPTPNGLFSANWKGRNVVSTVNPEWIMDWNYNIDNFRGISIHEYAQPGYPASHACVRLKEEDARFIYSWAEPWQLAEGGGERIAYGTPVIIFGSYDFSGTPPWKRLPEDPHAADVTEEEADEALRPFLQTIRERRTE